ncbi:MBL fold metallo-hydrolase [Pseudomonas chlororaphis]|nr:MBL fold metallo-hydrolase [Pseudomonas chlororaphis]
MKIHHLNCGTMHPFGAPCGLVCHVLLVETPNALVLVDSGLGLLDASQPGRRFGPSRFLVRPLFDPKEAAITQVTQLGFDPRDVRHILLTHFDADHVGGLADFPWASVHLTAMEAFAACHPQTLVERSRYLPAGREHGPQLVEHTPGQSESWRGFAAAKPLLEVAEGIVLVSLPGHTRGHAAYAIDAGDRWILHAGDAFYHHGQIDGQGGAPRSLTLMERLIAHDWPRVKANHQRLSELHAAGSPDLCIVNAHDPVLLDQVRRPPA